MERDEGKLGVQNFEAKLLFLLMICPVDKEIKK